jgi:hypothetical protein
MLFGAASYLYLLQPSLSTAGSFALVYFLKFLHGSDPEARCPLYLMTSARECLVGTPLQLTDPSCTCSMTYTHDQSLNIMSKKTQVGLSQYPILHEEYVFKAENKKLFF